MRRLLVLLFLTACTDIFGSQMPDGALAFTPSADYARWYARAETCSGKRGNFARVRWFWYDRATVPGLSTNSTHQAATWPESHRIAIARPYVADSAIVIHESLHDILGAKSHAPEFFGTPPLYADGKCGGLVAH